MSSFDIRTFGCKVNTYDTGLLQNRLAKSGFLLEDDQPQIHILNTCAVTLEATKEAKRTIRRLKNNNPTCTVVVTGCAAQVDTDQFAELTGADLIVANSHKGQIENLIRKHLLGELDQKVFKSNIFKKEDLEAGGGLEKGHTRSFLKIQDGCNSFCTYCVIPFARGKSRSIGSDELIRRVNDLYEQGVREVVLTGVHIGDYLDEEKAVNYRLEDLLEHLLLKTSIPRFRLSSLEPPELSDRLFELYSEERLCPHFHMSIQSANTKVLADMKRNYSHKEVEWSLNEIYKKIPNAFVGMDVIAGFPGESEDEFMDTYQRLSQLPWTRAHVFPYSSRPGTYAARMPGHLGREESLKRSAKLRELSSDRYAQRALDQVGETKKILLLGAGQQGLSRDYWSVSLESNKGKFTTGQEVLVKVIGYDHSDSSRMEGCLTGTLLS